MERYGSQKLQANNTLNHIVEDKIMRQNWKQIIKKGISTASILFPIRSNMSATRAREILNSWHPCPAGTCCADNKLNLSYDLQIIVPAYNVENFIIDCLESVTKQITHYNCLVTIVDDGSTDNTTSKLNNYVSIWQKKEQTMHIELITQHNRGISGARNRALEIIRGKYIMLLDSDDIIPPDTIEKMLDAAYKLDADVLQGSWFDFVETPSKVVNKHILPEEGLLVDNRTCFSGFPWGKLYKYTVMEHFQFPEGFWFEDTPISFILGAMQYKFAAMREFVYGYRLNPNGITATSGSSKKSVDSFWITERCLEHFPKFYLEYNQRAYEYLLQQTIMNWNRTKRQPRKIREAEFILTHTLFDKYFQQMSTENEAMKKIEMSIRKRQFIRFELLMIRK